MPSVSHTLRHSTGSAPGIFHHGAHHSQSAPLEPHPSHVFHIGRQAPLAEVLSSLTALHADISAIRAWQTLYGEILDDVPQQFHAIMTCLRVDSHRPPDEGVSAASLFTGRSTPHSCSNHSFESSPLPGAPQFEVPADLVVLPDLVEDF